MARSWFGGTSVDWLLTPYTFGRSTLVALRAGVTTLTLWSAATGGTPYTDLLDSTGSPITSVVMNGYQVPAFQGPDGILAMWADKGDGSPRELLEAQDLAAAASAAASLTSMLRFDTSQSLTATQKAQARSNADAQGQIIYRASDSVSLSAAVSAAPAGSTIRLAAGSYSVASLSNINKRLTLVGDGPDVSIIDAGSNAYGLNLYGPLAGATGPVVVDFRNIGFTGSTSAQVLVDSSTVTTMRFYDCRFSGFTACAIQPFGTVIICHRCTFTGNGVPSASTAVETHRAPLVRLKDCTFRYLFRGLYCTNDQGRSADVVVDGCFFDGGWCYLKSTGSGSGGTVTYSSTTVTDTGASFGTLPANSWVRAMPVRRTGTMTTIDSTRLTDSGASFITAGVKHGDIVRTSTAWAVVDEVVSATVIRVEEWLSLTDYQPVLQPTVSTSYTVYGLLLARIVSNTSTVITVDAWRDWDAPVSAPASGTLYELVPKGDYQVFLQGIDRGQVTRTTIRRAYSDSISAQLVSHLTIGDVTIYDSQDVGITLGQAGSAAGTTPHCTISNVNVHHAGTAGIWMGGVSDSTVVGVVIDGQGWLNYPGLGYAGLVMENCLRVNASKAVLRRRGHTNGFAAVQVGGGSSTTNTDLTFSDVRAEGYASEDFRVTGTTSNIFVRAAQPDIRINLTSSANAPLGDFVSTAAPAIFAGIGSTCRRTGGGAATSFYVKESGAGATTGWVAK